MWLFLTASLFYSEGIYVEVHFPVRKLCIELLKAGFLDFQNYISEMLDIVFLEYYFDPFSSKQFE